MWSPPTLGYPIIKLPTKSQTKPPKCFKIKPVLIVKKTRDIIDGKTTESR